MSGGNLPLRSNQPPDVGCYRPTHRKTLHILFTARRRGFLLRADHNQLTQQDFSIVFAYGLDRETVESPAKDVAASGAQSTERGVEVHSGSAQRAGPRIPDPPSPGSQRGDRPARSSRRIRPTSSAGRATRGVEGGREACGRQPVRWAAAWGASEPPEEQRRLMSWILAGARRQGKPPATNRIRTVRSDGKRLRDRKTMNSVRGASRRYSKSWPPPPPRLPGLPAVFLLAGTKPAPEHHALR